MNKKSRISRLGLISLIALATGGIANVPPARASGDLWSAYVGASLGHASLEARDSGLLRHSGQLGFNIGSLGSFDHNQFAYQLAAGMRWLKVLGVEVDYFHLGNGSASPYYSPPPSPTNFLASLKSAHISQKGEALFAMLYLPVPIVAVYVKAGVARLTTDLQASVSGPICPPGVYCFASLPLTTGTLHTTETTFAAGAGLQWTYGNWGLRAEYERFAALGEHPSLESIGATWSF